MLLSEYAFQAYSFYSVSVRLNFQNKTKVIIHDIRFKGKRKINWKEVEMFLKEYVGNCYEITENAEKIYIGTDFPDEFTGSKDTKMLRGGIAKAKANAAVGIPELIQICERGEYTDNIKEKHNSDAKYGWYRYNARFALPVYKNDCEIERYNFYSVRMLIRHSRDGKKYLYDLIRIKKEPSKPL